MNPFIQQSYLTLALVWLLSYSFMWGATPEENRKMVLETIPTLSDVSARNLYSLQLLSEGKTDAGSSDPDTLATYEALTPDARKKLALNFAAKIKDAEALAEVAKAMTPGMTPEALRKAISDALGAEADVKAGNLLFLKGLADGKSWVDASAGKRTDPDTLATYESLTPDVRKKLALNFASKIKDPAALSKLAKEFGITATGTPTPAPKMTPEDAHKVIVSYFGAEADVKAGNLLFLKGLADGKSWDDASAGKRADPDTLATYESLTPDARKKLAIDFAGKIKDATALIKLAKEFTRSSARTTAP